MEPIDETIARAMERGAKATGGLVNDLQAGKNLTTLPRELAQAMLANLHHAADPSKEIVGDVAL